MAVIGVRTKIIPVARVPLDLTRDDAVSQALLDSPTTILALQNTSSSGKLIYFADVKTGQPAAGSREGVLLRYGDVSVYEIFRADEIWVWTTSRIGRAANDHERGLMLWAALFNIFALAAISSPLSRFRVEPLANRSNAVSGRRGHARERP